MPLAQIEASGTIYYIHPDQLNTPQKMTDATGAVVWDRTQQPFGETYSITGTPVNNLRFPGQYYDADIALSYNYYRDYDATLGRYIEADPIGMKGSSIASRNIYGYAEQSPIINSDPSGLVGKTKTYWRSCYANEESECQKICGSRGVKSCMHSQIYKPIGIGPEQKLADTVNGLSCNCNEPDDNDDGNICTRHPIGCGAVAAAAGLALCIATDGAAAPYIISTGR